MFIINVNTSKQQSESEGKMNMDDEIMTAEEFFGGVDNGKKKPSRTCRKRGKKSGDKLLADLKAKVVMRVYGISRADALEMIARREAKKNVKMRDEVKNVRASSRDDEELMPAEEFFA